MKRALKTDGRKLATTTLTGCTTLECMDEGEQKELDIPQSVAIVHVMQRVDGVWYAEARHWAGTGSTPYRAVYRAFRKVSP